MRRHHILNLKQRVLRLGDRTAIMGILNVTPDSFSDGGLYTDIDAAVRHAKTMIAAGADLIDIGGESTRPGSTPVTASVEMARVMPIIEALKDEDVCLSIDTWKSEVAAKALEAGAHMVNDITAMQADPDMAAVVNDYEAGICLMHNAVLYRGSDAPGAFPLFGQKNKKKMQALASLDIAESIDRYINLVLTEAGRAGIPDDRIVLDPGFGFGVSNKENMKIYNRLSALFSRPFPWLVALSRKRFVKQLSKADLSVDLTTTLLGQSAIFAGAHMLRVHDVSLQRRYADIADAVLRAG